MDIDLDPRLGQTDIADYEVNPAILGWKYLVESLEYKVEFSQVLQALQDHAQDEDMQCLSLRTISWLAMAVPVRRRLMYGEIDVLGNVFVAMRAFPESSKVQTSACMALKTLLQDEPDFQEEVIENQEYTLVIQAVQDHSNCDALVIHGCETLNVIVHDEVSLDAMVASGVHKVLDRCIKTHYYNSEVIESCLKLLSLLTTNDQVILYVVEQGMVPDLLELLEKYIDSTMIQASGFTVFADIASPLFAREGDQEEQHWLKHIYRAMSLHRERANVQESCCYALSKLLEFRAELRKNIGEDLDKEPAEYPLHNVCVGALLMHGKSPGVFSAACTAIYWLAADNVEIQQALVHKNIYMAVLMGMHTHKLLPGTQEAGCKAIRGLCMFSQDHKDIVGYEALNELLGALTRFPLDAGVQIESVATIACLADNGLVRSKCMVEQIYIRVLSAMEELLDHGLYQEVAIEALVILCGSEGGPDILNEAETLDRVVTAMKVHHYNPGIQKKGLVLIQLLGEDWDYLSERLDLCRDLGRIIVSAMMEHSEVISVQAEGCVAMQILAERGDFISSILVENKAHERLFFIMENLQNYPGIQDLASECMFVLADICNLKSQMLQFASARGLTREVECLVQLGAEVNVGVGINTPLCHACQVGDTKMVAFLLEQGVSDIQTALRVSLELKHHQIVGMLLAYLGYDREAGIVSWSGLTLGDQVQVEWLIPTICGSSGPSTPSETAKVLAEKVKKTEHSRSTRLKSQSTSDSDSNEATYTPKKLSMRYPFQSPVPITDPHEYLAKLQEKLPDVSSLDNSVFEESDSSSKGPIAKLRKKIIKSLGKSPRVKQGQEGRSNLGKTPSSKRPRSLTRRKSVALLESYRENVSMSESEDSQARFSVWQEDLAEWKVTTLSSSNVPFSRRDPRKLSRVSSENNIAYYNPHALPGSWRRRSEVFRVTTVSESQAEGDTQLLSDSAIEDAPTFYINPIPPAKKNGFARSASADQLMTLTSDSEGQIQAPPPKALPVTARRPSLGLRKPRSPLPHPNDGSIFEMPPTITEDVQEVRSSSPGVTLNGSPSGPGHIRSMTPSHDSTSDGRLAHSPGNITHHRSMTPSYDFGLSRSPLEPGDTFLSRRQISSFRRRRAGTASDIHEMTASIKAVRHLDLSNNSINDLSTLTEAPLTLLLRFDLLEKLDLSHNKLQSFPEEMFNYMDALKNVDLSHNLLLMAPAKVLKCPRLESLDVSYNQIEQLDNMAYHQSPLREFIATNNLLHKIPEWMLPERSSCKAMAKLEHLNLAGNKIKQLPEVPLKLDQLKTLDLSYNYAKVIPQAFLMNLTQLETLSVVDNELEGLPSDEIAADLSLLHTVKLSHNRVCTKEPFYIPKLILQLASLRTLDLSDNGLTGLPEPVLWRSYGLRDLNVSHNDIRKIRLRSQVNNWMMLERLNISHNQLTELPRGIGQLTGLTSLDFSHNDQLTTVPDELGRLSRLFELPLHGLKLDMDEALLRSRTKDIVGYLHEKLKRSVEYYHIKMMVVGYGCRGKSTLLRALMRQKHPERALPTVGVVVKEWKFSGFWRKNKIVTYTLNTWDFAGQEEFYSTHQCFMSNRALYLVVYNTSKGEAEIERLRPWLVNIQARAPNCPVIIVGTHLDQVPKADRDEVVSDMRQRISELSEKPGFPEIKGMMEVDCSRENSGIERLRVLIKDVLDSFKIKGQAVMGQKIPASYVRLQELLYEESRSLRSSLPIIRHPRLQKIVADAELDLDADELQQAVRFLHESGVLLHYEDATLQLNDLYFINPGWLCRMMAQVVTVREINPFINDKGILRRDDVHLLFTGKRVANDVPYQFPPSLIPQYLRLLERFEIMLPQNDKELLIPSRLPVARPVLYVPTDERQDLILRDYEMEFIPLGFWARLITRLLAFASDMLTEYDFDSPDEQKNEYWREGIYVCYSQHAFFLLEPLEGASVGIRLTVPSSRLGARLLGQVVDHIDALIDEWYPGLYEMTPQGDTLVRCKIPCPHCYRNSHGNYSDSLGLLGDILESSADCQESDRHAVRVGSQDRGDNEEADSGLYSNVLTFEDGKRADFDSRRHSYESGKYSIGEIENRRKSYDVADSESKREDIENRKINIEMGSKRSKKEFSETRAKSFDPGLARSYRRRSNDSDGRAPHIEYYDERRQSNESYSGKDLRRNSKENAHKKPKLTKNAFKATRRRSHRESWNAGHSFLLDDLITQSDIEDAIYCPVHEQVVPLALLAPDIVLGDLEEKFTLLPEHFVFVPSPENLLGDGSFGRVYRARYKGQPVAVKVPNPMGDSHPHKLIRQEVTILRQLDHPCVVSMIAVGVRPRVLLLELAPHGSLGSHLSAGKQLGRGLQHRIIKQVAEGVAHLHHNKIIYRDLKPDNVLIFSTSITAMVNAKISDYGISRLATPYGLYLREGTPGYRAPEVARGEAYSFKADVYSFGILIYEIVTGGKHVFGDLSFHNELDDAVLRGRPIDPITKKGCAPWPDMEDLIDLCLQPIPDYRPQSSEVFNRLCDVELLSLKSFVPVSKDAPVECMTVRSYNKNVVEVWLAGGSSDCAQVSWISISSNNQQISLNGMVLSDVPLCMTSVGQSHVIVGAQSGKLWIYDAKQHQLLHSINPLSDAVLCLSHYCSFGGDYVFAGLADGRLVVFDTNKLVSRRTQLLSDNQFLQLGTFSEPVRCVLLHTAANRLYVGAGSRIHVISLEPTIDIEASWNTNIKGKYPGLISHICISKHLYLAKKGSSSIEMWNTTKRFLQKRFDLALHLHSSHFMDEPDRYLARVTAMTMTQNATLWVGTASGHLCLIDNNFRPLKVIHRYSKPIRCISWARAFDQFSMVLTGGTGFKTKGSKEDSNLYKHYGCVCMWEADIPQQLRALDDDIRKRQEYIQNHCHGKHSGRTEDYARHSTW